MEIGYQTRTQLARREQHREQAALARRDGELEAAKTHEMNVPVPEDATRCGGFWELLRQPEPRPHPLRAAQRQHSTTRPDATERRTQKGSMARSATSLDLRETPYRVGIALHEANEQRRLRVWLGPALLPIFQRADVGAQVSCEEAAGELHVLPDFREFVSADLRHGLRFHRMRPKSSFARTLISQSVKPFHQLIEQIALLSDVLRLAFSSSLMRSFNASRCLGVKSAISSLSYSVNSQNSGPPVQ